mgnify:FL=1
MTLIKRRLTLKYKDNISQDIKLEIMGANNTFGKLRKVLGDRYTDRELKAGLRHGLRDWLRTGLTSYTKITKENKTYSVVKA